MLGAVIFSSCCFNFLQMTDLKCTDFFKELPREYEVGILACFILTVTEIERKNNFFVD